MSSPLPEFTVLPKHIGIIMDGNGRWAKKRGLPRTEGHKRGAETFETISSYCADLGIPYVTFYAFSTENWSRPPEEVSAIMALLRDYLGRAESRQKENREKGFALRFIGNPDGLDEDIVAAEKHAETLGATGDEIRTVVNMAVNYGGREEILHSVRDIARRVRSGELDPADITEDTVSSGLYTCGQPDVDLIIRPSGEQRLSNFLLWQSAYAEFWYSDVLWPDFTERDLNEALRSYEQRHRRFGGV